MRLLFPILIVYLFLLGRAGLSEPQRHALLIGISDYESGHDEPYVFENLDCNDDVHQIRDALVDRFHFRYDAGDPAKSDFTILTSHSDTSAARLRAAFAQLIASIRPGDIVYIHYSGHGSQVPDDDDPTGFDETIVPSDYKVDQSNEISDKEIARYLAELMSPAHAPESVTLSFDSCHSGTITRGIAKARGKSYDDYRAIMKRDYPTIPIPHRRRLPDLTAAQLAAYSIEHPAGKTGYMVISACENEETATEDPDTDMGRLSEILAGALDKSTASTTGADLGAAIERAFRDRGFTDQHPHVAGAVRDLLLSATAVDPKPYMAVNGTAAAPVLGAGLLGNVTEGSTYAVYPDASSLAPADALAEAVVGAVRATSATLTVTQALRPFNDAALKTAVAVETQHAFGDLRLTVDRTSIQSTLGVDAAPVVDALQRLKIVSLVDPASGGPVPDLRVGPRNAALGGTITAAYDVYRSDIGATIRSASTPADIVDAVKSYAQYLLTLRLESNSPTYCVALRIVPAVVRARAQVDGKPVLDGDGAPLVDYVSDAPAAAGPVVGKVGRYFTIAVANTGTGLAHVALLDLGSDGSVTPIWPSETYVGNVVQPGQTVRLWDTTGEIDTKTPELFEFAAPDPSEIIKAFATKDYIPLARFQTRGYSKGIGEDESGLGALLASTVDDGTRAVAAKHGVPPAVWGTAEVSFKVVP